MKKIRKPALASFAMLFAAVLFVGQGSRGESGAPSEPCRGASPGARSVDRMCPMG